MRKLRLSLFVVVASLSLLCSGCLRAIKPLGKYSPERVGEAPDYAQPGSWALLPGQSRPLQMPPDPSADTVADVFFIHRTTYFFRFGHWNARLGNRRLNRYTDRTTIRQQASVFDAAGRLYAPRYRQATLYSFFDKQNQSSQPALDLAYADVKAAFLYYLAHYNHGRPFILAGHSQGTYHATRLLHELVDNSPALRKQLVAAYLVGYQPTPDEFWNLYPCRDSLQTGCTIAWNASLRGYDYPPYHGLLVTNPLNWKLDTVRAPATLNRGGKPYTLKRTDPQLTDAQIHNGLLWVTPPGRRGYPRLVIPGVWELRYSYHLADYGLFYLNVQENARARVRAWQSRAK